MEVELDLSSMVCMHQAQIEDNEARLDPEAVDRLVAVVDHNYQMMDILPRG